MTVALVASLVTFAIIAERPKDMSVVFEHGDGRVGTYVSSPWGFSTSTHWIEGPSGIVILDTQFLPSAIEEATRWIESHTGKKIVLAFVLHANPDKFNGTGFLKQHGVKVVTSEQVRNQIPEVHKKRVAWFYDRYKPDYPKDYVLPDSFGDKTTELSAAGLKMKAHVAGAGCGEAHVIVEFDGHVFPGDLVANGAHSWLEIGRPYDWIDRIAEMKALEPKFVHPGRGPSGGPELLDREEAYLRRVIGLVAAETPTTPADSDAIERVKDRLLDLYPGYRFTAFLDIGLPAVWARMAARR
jgi:glyoxylase-like metal-dependent hydrolase (beta-lactamase superfamily II)